jgi:hypothetical protein
MIRQTIELDMQDNLLKNRVVSIFLDINVRTTVRMTVGWNFP